MNKICKICGYQGENMWRDGKYYCATCGSEIDVTVPTPSPVSNTAHTSNAANAICPICKNADGNTMSDGKYHCAICGTTFDLPRQAYSYQPITGFSNNTARLAELEKEKSHRLGWGIFWLIFFWPVSIYHFVKLYEVSKEISKLK